MKLNIMKSDYDARILSTLCLDNSRHVIVRRLHN